MKKRLIVTLVILAILITGTTLAVRFLTARGTSATPAPVSTPLAPQKGTPTYDTVLPKGKTADSFGGWTRVSPADRNPVYAYVDAIGSTRVIVSEQELPESFRADPDASTKELALAYNADQELAVGSTKVYTGTSTKGVESVIFHTKSLLILIKADAAIDNAALSAYVNSLE